MTEDNQLFVLIVDRVEARRAEVIATLNPNHYGIMQAADVDSSLALFRKQRPAFVLIDGTLLERDPAGIINQFRHLPDGSESYIFAYARSDESLIDRLLNAGVDDCFLLPLNMRLIRIRLDNLAGASLAGRLQGEARARQVEDRYAHLFNSANDAILITDVMTGEILDANKQAIKWLGYAHEELIGMRQANLEFAIALDAEDHMVDELASKGNYIFEQNFISKQNQLLYGEVSTRLFVYDGRRALLNFIRDVAPRKAIEKSERDQRILAEALANTAAALNSTLKPQAVIERMLEQVTKVFPASMANVMFVEDEVAIIAGAVGYNKTYTIDFDLRLRIAQTPNLQTMATTRQPLAINNLANETEWVHEVESATWIQSYLGAPIIVEDEVIGFINLDHPIAYAFDVSQATNLMAFANQAGIALQNARLHENTLRYSENLELRVAERMVELSKANNSLRDQIIERQQAEARLDVERNLLRTLIDKLPNEVFIEDENGYIITANHTLLQNIGTTLSPDLHDNALLHRYPTETQKIFQQFKERVLYKGETVQDYPIHYLDPIKGEPQWLLVTRLPLRTNDGPIAGIIGINRNITEIKRTQQHLTDVVRGASCILWQCQVVVNAERTATLPWEMHIIDEEAAQSLLSLATSPQISYAKAWERAILESDLKRIKQESDAAILNEHEHYAVEFRCYDANGVQHWLREEVRINPLSENTYQLVGVATDITGIKRAEFTLQRINELLEQRVYERTEELQRSNMVLREQITERERAENAEREQRQLAEALRDIAITLSETLELTDVLDRILHHVMGVLPTHRFASVSLIEDHVYVRTIRYHLYEENNVVIKSSNETHYFLDTLPLYAEGMQTRKPIVVKDVTKDDRWHGNETMPWVRSFLAIPVMAENRVIGFLSMGSDAVGHFNIEHANRITAFSSQAGIAIKNAQLFSEVQQYAGELQKRVAERTQELEAERAQLGTILNGMVEGVAYATSDRKLRYVNMALAALSGYDEMTWTSEPHIWEVVYTGEQPYDVFEGVFTSRLQRNGHATARTQWRQRSGQIIDVELMASVIYNHIHEIIGVVTVVRDISAEKRLEEQKKRFIATASHELRTPITNLKTRLYLLEKKPETLERHMPVLVSVTERMRQLVDDLLDVSRFEHGAITLKRKALSASELVNGVVQMQQLEAEKRGQTVAVIQPEEPLYLFADHARMQQVMTNMITNAINYTPEGGEITIRIEQSTLDERTMVAISVCDTGVGIPKAMQKEVFQPFFRVNDYHAGMGLGLSITREIVELHSGAITVESEEGKGTCFHIYMPILTEARALGTEE